MFTEESSLRYCTEACIFIVQKQSESIWHDLLGVYRYRHYLDSKYPATCEVGEVSMPEWHA